MGDTQYVTDERTRHDEGRVAYGYRPGAVLLAVAPMFLAGSLTVVSIVDLVGWESQQQKRHDNQTAACAREINVPVQAVREAQTRPHDPLLGARR